MVTTRGPVDGRRPGVLLIATSFPPNAQAGTHRLLRFTRNLDALGWRVTVLTLEPSAYRAGVPMDDQLTARLPAGVKVIRTTVRGRRPAQPPAGASPSLQKTAASAARVTAAPRSSNVVMRALRRTWHDLTSTPDRDLPWMLTAVSAGLRGVREEGVDVILSSAPPFTCHLVAAAIARRSQVPWVADFRDPWARAPWGLEWRNHGWTGVVHRRLERMTVHRARRVVLNTHPMRDDFLAHYPSEDVSKFVTIPNGYDLEALDGSVRPVARTAPAGTLVLCHTGNLYQARDPRPLFRALASLRSSGRVPGDAFRLQLVGGSGGEFDARGEVGRLGLEEVVEFLPPVSHGESLGYLRAADVLLVVQPDTKVQVPVKLYEYLWARKPILALASDGAVADLVRQGGVGLVAEAADEAAIGACLARMYDQRATLAADFVAPEMFLASLEGRQLSLRLHEALSELTGA